MNRLETLYCRSITGEILQWNIVVVDNKITINSGIFGTEGRDIVRTITTAPKRKTLSGYATDIALRKYQDKINKNGYKPKPKDVKDLHNFLDMLSVNKEDANLRLKPQKAFKGFPAKWVYPCIAQPKVNGLRAILRYEMHTVGEGIFKTTIGRAVFRSMNGLEYVLSHITDNLNLDMFGMDKDVVFDGELYVRGATLNRIRASVPTVGSNGTLSKVSQDETKVGFVMYDLAMSDMAQSDRLELINSISREYNIPIYTNAILNQVYILNVLGSMIVNNRVEAENVRDMWIVYGFEGAILRVIDSDYGFGTRSSKIMAKLKNFDETECEILGIYLTGEDNVRSYINFVLRNDINDGEFEATPLGDEAQRQEYLNNQDTYIGQLATVKFYERSGVKKVPFHGNVVSVRDVDADVTTD